MSRSYPSHDRAHDWMLHQKPEQRESVRVHCCLSATATIKGHSRLELVALVRDISNKGLMFYANFPNSAKRPRIGSEVSLRFALPIDQRNVPTQCTGKVVRLVKYPAGAATGIALRLNRKDRVKVN
jgi:hypothetical protein